MTLPTITRLLARFFVILILLGTFSLVLVAQQNYGTILGTVTDPTGAVVPGATVTVTNAGTQTARQITTDKDGFYQVLSLPIGTYTVGVEREGFKKQVTTAKDLEINQNLRVDITLQIGSKGDIVTVEGSTSGVEAVSATVGQSITSRPILDLPLNGRNML